MPTQKRKIRVRGLIEDEKSWTYVKIILFSLAGIFMLRESYLLIKEQRWLK